MDSTTQNASDHVANGVSRRAVLRGAAMGGAFAWATPVVQSVGGTAWATGSAGSFVGTGFSEVAFVLRKGTKYYRAKYVFGGNTFTRSSNAEEPVDNACGGKIFPKTQKYAPAGGYLLPTSAIFAPDAAGYQEGKPFRAVLGEGVSLVAYFIHQGSCCAFFETPKPGTTPTLASLPTKYNGCSIDYVVTSAVVGGKTAVSFPPAYNKCKDVC